MKQFLLPRQACMPRIGNSFGPMNLMAPVSLTQPNGATMSVVVAGATRNASTTQTQPIEPIAGYEGATATGTAENEIFHASISTPGTENWHVQFNQNGIPLEQNIPRTLQSPRLDLLGRHTKYHTQP